MSASFVVSWHLHYDCTRSLSLSLSLLCSLPGQSLPNCLSGYGFVPQGTKLPFFLGKAPTLPEFSPRLRVAGQGGGRGRKVERAQRSTRCRHLKTSTDNFGHGAILCTLSFDLFVEKNEFFCVLSRLLFLLKNAHQVWREFSVNAGLVSSGNYQSNPSRN